MKRTAFLLPYLLCCCMAAFAQNSPKTVQDTSKALRQKYQPVVVPDPAVTGPQLKTDSSSYDNSIYHNGIKNAEYQNRGAEDRRNPNSADPNAIPDRRMPDQRVAVPDTVK